MQRLRCLQHKKNITRTQSECFDIDCWHAEVPALLRVASLSLSFSHTHQLLRSSSSSLKQESINCYHRSIWTKQFSQLSTLFFIAAATAFSQKKKRKFFYPLMKCNRSTYTRSVVYPPHTKKWINCYSVRSIMKVNAFSMWGEKRGFIVMKVQLCTRVAYEHLETFWN